MKSTIEAIEVCEQVVEKYLDKYDNKIGYKALTRIQTHLGRYEFHRAFATEATAQQSLKELKFQLEDDFDVLVMLFRSWYLSMSDSVSEGFLYTDTANSFLIFYMKDEEKLLPPVQELVKVLMNNKIIVFMYILYYSFSGRNPK